MWGGHPIPSVVLWRCWWHLHLPLFWGATVLNHCSPDNPTELIWAFSTLSSYYTNRDQTGYSFCSHVIFQGSKRASKVFLTYQKRFLTSVWGPGYQWTMAWGLLFLYPGSCRIFFWKWIEWRELVYTSGFLNSLVGKRTSERFEDVKKERRAKEMTPSPKTKPCN